MGDVNRVHIRQGRAVMRALGMFILWLCMSALCALVALPIAVHADVTTTVISWLLCAYFVSCMIGSAIAVRAA